VTQRVPMGVLQAVIDKRWAIKPEYLQTILGVVMREVNDKDAVLMARGDGRSHSVEFDNGYSIREGVAVIDICGAIFPRATLFTDLSSDGTSIEGLTGAFNHAISNDSVKAILFNIDSPGGDITGIHEFANLIYESRGIKPIYAYINGDGCSAAIWIATSCEYLIADKTARVGSIGVVCTIYDDSEMMEREGIKKYEIVSSQSPYKRVDVGTEDGRSMVQEQLDELANIFIGDVARNRGVSESHVTSKFGQGGVLLSDRAKKVGLIDSIGSLDKSIAKLSKGVKGMGKVSGQRTADSGQQTDTEIPLIEPVVLDDESDTSRETIEEGKKVTGDKEIRQEGNKVTGDLCLQADASKFRKEDLHKIDSALYNSIVEEGVMSERNRIKGIFDISLHSDNAVLVQKAMFENPITAEQLAWQIVMADKEKKAQARNDYMSDVSALEPVSRSVGEEFKKDDAQLKREAQEMAGAVKGAVHSA